MYVKCKTQSTVYKLKELFNYRFNWQYLVFLKVQPNAFRTRQMVGAETRTPKLDRKKSTSCVAVVSRLLCIISSINWICWSFNFVLEGARGRLSWSEFHGRVYRVLAIAPRKPQGDVLWCELPSSLQSVAYLIVRTAFIFQSRSNHYILIHLKAAASWHLTTNNNTKSLY